MEIAEKIKIFRREAGLTQKELAKKTGLSIATIQGYEQSKYKPKIDATQKIAEALNVNVNDLLDWQDIPEIANEVYASSLTYLKDCIVDKRYHLSEAQLAHFNNKIDAAIRVGNDITDTTKRCEYFESVKEDISKELLEHLFEVSPYDSLFTITDFLSYYFAFTRAKQSDIGQLLLDLYENKYLLRDYWDNEKIGK